MSDTVSIAALTGNGQFSAYRAEPAGEPHAVIIVIQEIFGVNAGIRKKAEDWASLGYVAVAPDMFWRFAPGYDVDPDVPEQMADAFEVRKQFDPDKAVHDVEAVIRWTRQNYPGKKIGIVGFCMGGRVAFLTATRTDIDASVGYYGGMIDQALGEAHAIANPLMLHFGKEDSHIAPDKVAAVKAALADNAHVTIHEYDGAGHGFADTFGSRRNEAAAQEADARTRAFFAEHLG